MDLTVLSKLYVPFIVPDLIVKGKAGHLSRDCALHDIYFRTTMMVLHLNNARCVISNVLDVPTCFD
jgi:hypothetical protein